MRLSRNTVLIAGRPTGIGFTIAESLLQAGSQVILCGRREEELKQARARHPELHIKVCDVGEIRERKELAAWVGKRFNDLNVLVNNACEQEHADLLRDKAGSCLGGDDKIRINLEASFALCGLFVPLLMGRDEPAIINVSPELAFVPSAQMSTYSATKASLHAFSMALRHQLSKAGINVYEVVPPTAGTESNDQAGARRHESEFNVIAKEFAVAVMKGLEADLPEIAYGNSAQCLRPPELISNGSSRR